MLGVGWVVICFDGMVCVYFVVVVILLVGFFGVLVVGFSCVLDEV